MPCTGCFGPTSRVKDQGAKALSAIASTVASNDAAEIERILERHSRPRRHAVPLQPARLAAAAQARGPAAAVPAQG